MFSNIEDLKDNVFTSGYDSIVHDSNDSSIIFNGDCIELMKHINNESVDLIFADEPYNIKKDFDGILDFKDPEKYIEWNKEWIKEAMNILKPNGTMYLMTSTQFMPYIDVFVSDNYNVVSRIVWMYDSSGVQSKKSFGSLYEPIIMITKTKKSKYTFNYKDILVEAKTGSKRKLIDYRKNPPRPYNTKKVPGNVWQFNRVRYRMDEYENHPTQKPESLLERIIKVSSNKNDIVFDPFGGSFTTSKVAQDLGRFSISVDLNPSYYEIGLRRLNISNFYNGKDLKKEKKRKTNNLSKNVRTKNKNSGNSDNNDTLQTNLFD